MAVSAIDVLAPCVRAVAICAVGPVFVPLVHIASFFCERMAYHAQVVIVLLFTFDQAYVQFLFMVAVCAVQIAGIASVLGVYMTACTRFTAMVLQLFMAGFAWPLLRLVLWLFVLVMQVILCPVKLMHGFGMAFIACFKMGVYQCVVNAFVAAVAKFRSRCCRTVMSSGVALLTGHRACMELFVVAVDAVFMTLCVWARARTRTR